MPFCPICKNEYREGFSVCHECKVPLVSQLPEEDADAGKTTGYEKLSEEMQEYPEEAFQEVLEEELQQAEETMFDKPYVDKRERAEEYKSSGIVLVLVGGVGMVLLFPYIFGSQSHNMIFNVGMSVLFAACIISGISSFAKVKKIAKQADIEEQLIADAKAFMESYLIKETLEQNEELQSTEGTEEELYFKRFAWMRDRLKQEYPDMEDALCEKLIEERYNEIYEDNNH
jgi:hypothetical protein